MSTQISGKLVCQLLLATCMQAVAFLMAKLFQCYTMPWPYHSKVNVTYGWQDKFGAIEKKSRDSAQLPSPRHTPALYLQHYIISRCNTVTSQQDFNLFYLSVESTARQIIYVPVCVALTEQPFCVVSLRQPATLMGQWKTNY